MVTVDGGEGVQGAVELGEAIMEKLGVVSVRSQSFWCGYGKGAERLTLGKVVPHKFILLVSRIVW